MVQRMFVLFKELPGLMRLGVLMLVIGGVLDLLYHAAPPGWAMRLDGYLGLDGVGAHLLTLLGVDERQSRHCDIESLLLFPLCVLECLHDTHLVPAG